MIVSNFTNGSPGALQGIDFLARSAGPIDKESSSSSFSELLGGAGNADSLVPVSKDVRVQSRGGSEALGANKTADSKIVGQPTKASEAGPVSAPTQDCSVVAPALDDAPPVFRDPRLDDPEELALEAAAIALAASLLAKPQEPVLLPDQAEELTGYLGSEQGGGKAHDPASSVEVQAGALVPLAMMVDEVSPLVQLKGEAGALEASNLTSASVSGFQQASEVQSEQTPAAPRLGVAPRFVAAVVVNATEQQATALAEKGADFVPSQKSLQVLGSTGIAAGLITEAQADPSLASQQIADSVVTLGQQAQDSASRSEQSGPLSISDAELLSSPIPVNPAAAFFAAQVQQPNRQPSGRSAETDTLGDSEADQTLNLILPSDAGADAELVAPNSLRLDKQSSGGDFGSKQSKASHEPPAGETQRSYGLTAQDGTELGTLGAEDPSVYSEASPALERKEESSTPLTTRGQESSSLTSSSADFSSTPTDASALTTPSSLVADSTKIGHASVSRPTVLAPVNVRSSELFNVVQNALERARSENPSHLAVEVTLEDGSSFGLEVRMSVSGLQASFRSESQPLLKFLENGWSGFLAKETAESKVVSAAFEGRSGFGEFSNNGSNAGERRQQFEDNSAASRLASSDLKSSPSGAAVGEAEKKLSPSVGGMAVYA